MEAVELAVQLKRVFGYPLQDKEEIVERLGEYLELSSDDEGPEEILAEFLIENVHWAGERQEGDAPFDEEQPVEVLARHLTLATDLFGASIESGQAISIFYCPDFSCLLRSRRLQGPPSLVAIGHADCARGVNDNILDSPLEGRCLVAGQIVEGMNEYRERDQSSKIGGLPGLIQRAGVTYDRGVLAMHMNDRYWNGPTPCEKVAKRI